MSGKLVLLMISFAVSITLAPSTFRIQPIEPFGTIYIRADGSIDPPTAPISTVDNVTYALASDINDSIVVERDNILVDGNGHTLQGTGSANGIFLSCRSNVTVQNTAIKAFEYGIRLYHCLNVSILGNNITENSWYGISLYQSSRITLRGNTIAFNKHNFGVLGLSLSEFVNDVDVSNTVNGKPIYCWINKRELDVPPDAGYVALVNCTNMTVRNLNLTNNGEGVLLVNTTNSSITRNSIANNYHGVVLEYSPNNSVSGNNITANDFYGIYLYRSLDCNISGNNVRANGFSGVLLDYSSNNAISGNNITANDWFGIYLFWSSNRISGNNITANNLHGIVLEYSSNNIISENCIAANKMDGIRIFESSNYNIVSGNNVISNCYGIYVLSASGNIVYHNNFVNNTDHACVLQSVNTWDDGYPSGGNYWSNYAGVDDGDGIGDTPYVIGMNNTDRDPLIAPINIFDVGTWNGTDYNIDIVSNSTLFGFYFNPDEGAFIKFNVTGQSGTFGFCRVTVPRDLLWVEDGWTVYGGSQSVNYTIIPDESHTYLYFTYNHTAESVTIHGTHVIAEFPSLIILPSFMIATIMIATILVGIIHRRRDSM